jgi:hypothetical protein
MVERCTRAALVTATIDPKSGEASGLVAAQLKPGAESEPYASILLEPGGVLRGSIFSIHPPLPLEAQVTVRPWHMYDFDLATLGAAFEARAGSRAPMRSAWRWHGWATAGRNCHGWARRRRSS